MARRKWIGPVVMVDKDSEDFLGFLVDGCVFAPAMCVHEVEQLWNLPPLAEGRMRRAWLKVSKKPLSKDAFRMEFNPEIGWVVIDNSIHYLYEWLKEQGRAILGEEPCDCYVELWYEDVRCR